MNIKRTFKRVIALMTILALLAGVFLFDLKITTSGATSDVIENIRRSTGRVKTNLNYQNDPDYPIYDFNGTMQIDIARKTTEGTEVWVNIYSNQYADNDEYESPMTVNTDIYKKYSVVVYGGPEDVSPTEQKFMVYANGKSTKNGQNGEYKYLGFAVDGLTPVTNDRYFNDPNRLGKVFNEDYTKYYDQATRKWYDFQWILPPSIEDFNIQSGWRNFDKGSVSNDTFVATQLVTHLLEHEFFDSEHPSAGNNPTGYSVKDILSRQASSITDIMKYCIVSGRADTVYSEIPIKLYYKVPALNMTNYNTVKVHFLNYNDLAVELKSHSPLRPKVGDTVKIDLKITGRLRFSDSVDMTVERDGVVVSNSNVNCTVTDNYMGKIEEQTVSVYLSNLAAKTNVRVSINNKKEPKENNYYNNIFEFDLNAEEDGSTAAPPTSSPVPNSEEYHIPENYLTKYYPEKKSGPFASFTVSAPSIPPSGSGTKYMTKTSYVEGQLDTNVSNNGVPYNEAKGDTGSYTDNYRYPAHKEYYEVKRYKNSPVWGYTDWSYSGRNTYSSPQYGGTYTDYRNASVKAIPPTTTGGAIKHEYTYDVYTRSDEIKYYTWGSWSETGSKVDTCEYESCSSYGRSRPSGSSGGSGTGQWETEWRERWVYNHKVYVSTSNSYTFYDTYQYKYNNFEEFDVDSWNTNPSMIDNKLVNDYKSDSAVRTAPIDLTFDNVNSSLLFSRAPYGDRPTLASWKGSSVTGFTSGITPGVRRASGYTSGIFGLGTNINKVYWWKDWERNLFPDEYLTFPNFTPPNPFPSVTTSTKIDTYLPPANVGVGGSPVSKTNQTLGRINYTVSGQNIKFYPEVPMKYDTMTARDQIAYIIGEYARIVNPVSDYLIEYNTNASMKVTAPFVKDAKASALMARKGNAYEPKGVLPQGSAITVETSTPLTFTLRSYHLRLKSPYNTAWGNPADTSSNKHNDFVNSFYNNIVPLKMQYYNYDRNTNLTLPASAWNYKGNVSVVKSNTTSTTYPISVINSELTTTLPSTIANEMELRSRLASSMQVRGGTGGWYNEQTTEVFEVVEYRTTITVTKVKETFKIPMGDTRFGPAPKNLTTRYSSGDTSGIVYDIRNIPVNAGGSIFNTSINYKDLGYWLNFIVPDVTITDLY